MGRLGCELIIDLMVCAKDTDMVAQFLDSLTLQIINHYGIGKS